MYTNIKEAGLINAKSVLGAAAGWKAKEIHDKVQFADNIKRQMDKQASLNLDLLTAYNEASFAEKLYTDAIEKMASIDRLVNNI